MQQMMPPQKRPLEVAEDDNNGKTKKAKPKTKPAETSGMAAAPSQLIAYR